MTNSLNILSLIMDASIVVKAVMALLLLLSVIGWLIIFRLSMRIGSIHRHDVEFEEWFWQGDNLNKLYQSVQQDDSRVGLEYVFCLGYQEYLRLSDLRLSKQDIGHSIERKCRVGLGRQQAFLEAGLPTLASIGSVAPYIGLFGTVWGIMTAFIGLADAESVSLATVAPGIAEALIATAMGLLAAIPASLFFNHFTAKANQVYEARTLFCEELTGVIERQYLQQSIDKTVNF